jgi:hypothetical protein
VIRGRVNENEPWKVGKEREENCLTQTRMCSEERSTGRYCSTVQPNCAECSTVQHNTQITI